MIFKDYTTPDDDAFNKESELKMDEVLKLETVYKYSDYIGGYAMLENSTLRFASPSQFNDPFDCYSRLIDYSNVTDDYLDCLIERYYSSYERSKRREIKRELRRTIGTRMVTDDSFRQNNKITCFTE